MKKTLFLLIIFALIFALTGFCISQNKIVPYKDKYGNNLNLQLNDKTNLPHRIFGMKLKIDQYGFNFDNVSNKSVDKLSEKFFNDYSDIFNIKFQDLKLRRCETDGNMWFISYNQTYKNLPVYSSEIGYSISKNGEIFTFGADAYPDINISTIPKINYQDAVKAAEIIFNSDKPGLKNMNELCIYPKEENDEYVFHLVYKVNLVTADSKKNNTYYIDAEDGKLIGEENNIRETDVHGRFKVQYRNKANDNINLGSDGISSKIVLKIGTAGYTQYSNNSGYYSFNNVTLDPDNNEIKFNLENSWVYIHNLLVANLNKSYPVGSAGGEYNCEWEDSDESNVFWYVNKAHDYYKNSFNYSGMDYPVCANIDSTDMLKNSYSDGTNIGFGSIGNQPWARSSDVIFHEYTHCVVYHIYNGWIDPPKNVYSEACAMDQGFSDYFACSINNDENYGDDVQTNRHLSNTLTFDPSQNCDVNGKVIGGACWDLNRYIGNINADNLVFKALQISPQAHNFKDFYDNSFYADKILYGGYHLTNITQAFRTHGICPLNISISGPTYLDYNQQGTYTVTVSGGTPGYSYDWHIYQNDHWADLLGESQTFTFSSTQGFRVRCVVTDNANNQGCSNWISVIVGSNPKIEKDNQNNPDIVNEVLANNLSQCFPNPFNPSAKITFSIKDNTFVSLKIYNSFGQEVRNLVNEYKSSGIYELNWEPDNLPSGIYYYRLRAGNFSDTKKMLYVK